MLSGTPPSGPHLQLWWMGTDEWWSVSAQSFWFFPGPHQVTPHCRRGPLMYRRLLWEKPVAVLRWQPVSGGIRWRGVSWPTATYDVVLICEAVRPSNLLCLTPGSPENTTERVCDGCVRALVFLSWNLSSSGNMDVFKVKCSLRCLNVWLGDSRTVHQYHQYIIIKGIKTSENQCCNFTLENHMVVRAGIWTSSPSV